jgi:hypothetical protein
MNEAQRRQYYSHLNRFTRQTRCGTQGVIGRNEFLVIDALFSFQREDGELCPSKAAIGYRAQLGITLSMRHSCVSKRPAS